MSSRRRKAPEALPAVAKQLQPRPPTNAESLGLDHLRAFIAVVETRSQVAAARQLRVAQGTISRHIERVQEHFGGGLFESGGGSRLSTRGLLVEQSVRAAMAELSRTRDRLDRHGPVLRIGYIRAVRVLVENALRSQAQVPGMPAYEVRLLELTSDKQASALARRELDIAICYVTSDLASRGEVEESLVAEEPFALVIPERAYVNGKVSRKTLQPLLHARLLERFSPQFGAAAEAWLSKHKLQPERSVECEVGSEILAYAGAGYGYGFLPALWSMSSHQSAVFVPPTDFDVTVKIAAYSLRHVTPWVTQLREHVSAAARTALRDFRSE
jgi:DNA-binding transcriptional LysR family regulator